MRYPNEHKAKTRERVIQEASKALRTGGLAGVSVSEVMSRAGLTNGAFYGHFTSKDDLVAKSIEHMFEERYEPFLAELEDLPPAKLLREFLDMYLSIEHVTHPEGGCPLPPLGASVPLLSREARDALLNGARELIGAIAVLLKRLEIPDSDLVSRSIVAEIVGAVTLARLTSETGEAEKMLSASRNSIVTRIGLDGRR